MALTRITQGVIKPNENYVVNNINSSGVTTSTNFKTGTSNLHNVGIEIAGINVLGADTPIGLGATIYNSGAAIFSGDVKVGGALTVGGVLTYEDVTNIDSVGVITARGDISIADKIVHTGDTNTAIRFPSNDTFTVETVGTERLRIDSDGRLGVNISNHSSYYSAADDLVLRQKDGGDSGITIRTGTANSGLICFADGASATNNQYRRGQIRYHHNTDSMDFTTGGNTAKLTITSDGKIGIGTNSGYGDAKLTVEGTAALTNNDTTLQIKDNVNDAAAGRGGNIGFSAYVNGTQRTFAGIGGLKSAAGTGSFSGDLALYTRVNGESELDERLRITSAGKVGIGVANPEAKLQIAAGHIRLDNEYRIGTAASGDTPTTGTKYKNADYISWIVDNGEKARIDANGRIEVGHTAAVGSGKLQVFTKDDDAIDILSFASANSEGGRLTFYRNRNTTYGSNTKVAINDELGRIDFRGMNTEGTDNYEVGASIRAEVDGTPGSGVDASDMPGRLIFLTTPDGTHTAVERLRIKSDGNIGVGTDNPTRKLHVFGDGDTTGIVAAVAGDALFDLSNTGNGNFSGINFTRERSTGSVVGGSIWMPSVTANNSALLYLQTQTASAQAGVDSALVDNNGVRVKLASQPGGQGADSAFSVEVGASERFRVGADGKVGIGTDLSGADGIFQVFGSGTVLARFGNSISSSYECLTIRNNTAGYPGISNDSSADTLDLKSLGSVQATIDSNNNSTGKYFRVMTNGEGGAGTELFRVRDDGNVDINGTPPWSVSGGDFRNLSISGEGASGSGFLWLGNGAAATNADFDLGRVNFCNGSNIVARVIGSTDTSANDDGRLTFYTKETGATEKERMRINSNGTVNIGGANEVQLDASNDEILYLHGAVVGANVDFGYGMRIDLDDDNTGTTSADRERGCGIFQFNGNCYGGDASNETRIWNIFSDVNCNADYDNVYGVYSDCKSNHDTGTVGHMRGLYAITQHANTGAVGEMIGVYGLSQLTTGSSSLTVNDVIGVKGRVNMCAGTSTANATDVVAVWGSIDNDNNTAQATGGKCALFYGQYDKTTGLHNPQGIRLDTDVPNYFRGDIAIDGGGNFLPTGNHKIHIRNGTNATGILLEQTGNQYSVISGDSNRSAAENAILDIRGYWSGTQVAKIRFETGADTTNKDDGEIQFSTAASGTITDRMHIQPNGEIAMKSNAAPGDALANLHVQNGTFRVSQSSAPTTAYTQITAHANGTDGNRHRIATWNNANLCSFAVDQNGTVMAHASHYAGRTRGDANNAQPEMYRHGAHHFTAYSARTDDSTAYRSRAMLRAWDAGDNGDRNVIYYVNSDSDTETASETADQKFGIKADGRAQFGNSVYAGRVESDAGSPTSVYGGASGTTMIAYPGNSGMWSRIDARTTDNTDRVFGVDSGGGVVIKFESQGNGRFDGGADIGNASDYAEYFEWTDGNTSNADRRGITVVMDGEKIRPATGSDDTSKIIGVVSANPAVVGDSAWSEWQQAHQKDAYGSFVIKDEEFLVWNRFGTFIDTDGVEKPNPQPNINDYNRDADHQVLVSDIEAEKAKGNIPQAAIDQNLRVTKPSRIYNPDYDKTKTYVPRSDRKEWSAIGLVGKLVVRRGQPIGANWILMKSNVGTDPNDNSIVLDKYLVR